MNITSWLICCSVWNIADVDEQSLFQYSLEDTDVFLISNHIFLVWLGYSSCNY